MRDIDRIIRTIEEDDRIPPVHKRALINRIEPPPTRAELDRAAAEVYGPNHSPGAANMLPDITCTIPGHCDVAAGS